MERYFVSFVDTIEVGSRVVCSMREVFTCLADDFAHAEEQTKNAYTNCIIISIDKEKQNGIHDSKS